jgi:hypothetical protein
MARFRSNRPSRPKAKLLPARSITSLRETVEVHPYLVLGPADLQTMVNALFPERRPVSSSIKDVHFSGLRSSASSISGISTMSTVMGSMPAPARNAFDNASIVSNSGSSVISDVTTSREPLLDDGSGAQRFSSASLSSNQNQRLSLYEDDGYELRIALYEMTQTLGVEGTSGACHPCAERWTVLFMSPDGQNLSTQMLHDPDDEAEEEEFTTSSDDEDEVPGSRPDLDKDYHQLRDSILKLVEDYEIPQSLESKAESKTFSNRTSTLESPRRKHRSRPGSSAQAQSKNPYRLHENSPIPEKISNRQSDSKALRQRPDVENIRKQEDGEPPPVLITMLEAAEAQCQAQSDFVNAHLYWKTLNQLHQLSSASLKKDGFASLLSIFSRGPRDSIRRSASAIEEYDAWLVWLKQSQERHDVTIESMMKRLKALRDKMWYVTDVRNSAAYEGARNIAVALKCMASPKKASYLPPTGVRPRNISKSSTNNFLLKTEAQVMDMMAAVDDQGGPNKLSDEQSEKTLRWLSQFGIENFCKGEERIHRFCLELETCINKLVGDNLMDGPVLWSSELYYRDKRILDSGRQKGDLFINGFGSLNISGDDISEADPGRRGLRNTDFNRTGGLRDLRAMSARNTSQQSFDSGRFSMSRMSNTGDLMDSQDYFGMASPVLTIDSAATFWSPFQTRAQSPTTSISSHRPGTASSTNETVMMKEERANQAKQRFLIDLKQTLTSLLVSDLGTLVFSRGSETDSWFSGDLGEDCIERKEKAERKARRKLKRRTLEKKKSFRDLRGAHKPDMPAERTDSFPERMERLPSNSSRSTGHGTPDVHSTNEGSSTSEVLATSARKTISKDQDSPDFPYRKAFQRLLRMFSVHPNPYAKLNALYELEHLIIAFLTPSAPRRPRMRQDPLTTTAPSPEVQHINAFGHTGASATTPRAKNLEEAIDNCRERRSHTFTQPEPPSPAHRNTDRSLSASHPASTDMIVDVLQDLFRDADIRPKTLFRDLQFIASFVPAAILDKTERGKAFWDAGLAALGLKQDVCRTLIEIADEVVVHYTQTRKTTSSNINPEAAPPTTATGELMKYSMQDAGKMWVITAKEGDPVAERELAIFYLTHPELVERVTAPLSKPRETFKAQVMEMHGGGGGTGKEGDRERSDPATMCVAYHWMELSAQGGDELAKKYLRQREELNAIP